MKVWAKRQSGFTIVELLIVIVVIGILAAIVIVAYNGIQNRARQVKAESDITNAQKLIEAYYAINGIYPVTASSLNPDWGTATARTDDNCPSGTSTADWIPGLNTSLPQSTPINNVAGLPGCYMYVSDGTQLYCIGLEYAARTTEPDDVPATWVPRDGFVASTVLRL